MLRKHFMMSGLEKPDYIITYYADLKVPFIGGEETKNLTMWATGSESEPLAEFKVVSNKYSDGYGEWGIKTSNPTVYYSLILDLYNNTYYADSGNPGSVTGIIFPEGITEIGGLLLENNSSLIDVKLPSSLLELNNGVFKNSGIKHLTFPVNIDKLEYSVIEGSNNLLDITLQTQKTIDIDESIFTLLNLHSIYVHLDNILHYISNYPEYLSYFTWFKNATNVMYTGDLLTDAVLWKLNNSNSWNNAILEDCGAYKQITPSNIGNYLCGFTSSCTTLIVPNNVKVLQSEFCYHSGYRNLYLTGTEIIAPRSFISYSPYKFCGSLYIPETTLLIIPNEKDEVSNSRFDYITVDNQNTIYDSRLNCNAIIETNTNKLLCAGFQNPFIPEGVVTLESGCLTNVQIVGDLIIPSTVTSIKKDAFLHCNISGELLIPNSVQSVHYDILSTYSNYYSTKVGTLTLESPYITDIDGSDYTKIDTIKINTNFNGCCSMPKTSNTPKLIIGPNVTDLSISIGYTNITEITIPDNVIYALNSNINYSLLAYINGGNNLRRIGLVTNTQWYENLSDGLVTFNKILCKAKNVTSSDIVIPENIRTISQQAFKENTYVENITLPNSINIIDDLAFMGCSKLTTINIPSSVEFIGNDSFSKCTMLSEITIPEGVVEIGNFAFSKCSSLTSLHLPKTVTKLGYNIIIGCNNITSITIDPDNPKYYTIDGSNVIIEKDTNKLVASCNIAFIPEGIECIQYYSLTDNAQLIEVEIPNTVKTIELYASSSTSLKKIILPKTIERFDYMAVPSSTIIYYLGSIDDYVKSKDIIFGYHSTVYLNDILTKDITEITIPDTVTYISDYKFYSLLSETVQITIHNKLTYVGHYAFDKCVFLEDTLDLSNAQTIGSRAFANNTSITKLILGTTDVYNNSFTGCTNLKTLTLTDNVNKFEYGNIQSLEVMNLPSSITYISNNVFSYLNKIRINYNGTLSQFMSIECSKDTPDSFSGYDLYINDALVTEIEIPSTIYTLKYHILYYCTSLTKLTLPEDLLYCVKSVPGNCDLVYNCVSGYFSTPLYNENISFGINVRELTKVKFENSTRTTITINAATIGNYLLRNNKQLLSVRFTDRLSSLGDYIFGCPKLADIYYESTKQNWKKIVKSTLWKDGVPSTCVVHCTDGDIPIAQA